MPAARQRALLAAVALAAAVWALGVPAVSQAAHVLVLGRDGQALWRNDPFLSPFSPTEAAAARKAGPLATTASGDVRAVLARLRRNHAISAADYYTYRHSFTAALASASRLRGTRSAELQAVIANLEGIAARGLLTPSRLPVLFLTLNRNRRWWTTGPLLDTYERVQFAGSQLVWEYYPGQGIQLQELGSFSTADALCIAGPRRRRACVQLLGELIPLAARRAGRLAWEYYFYFDGGAPPWTSAISQGTALQALADAYKATRNPYYLAVGRRALWLFTAAPPSGVAVKTPLGARFVEYTFDPARGDEVINAFLQGLIGLLDFARTGKSPSPLAARLFAAGNAEARAELPQYVIPGWSLYQPGIPDDLSYHELVTGFLQQLCARTKVRVYCTTAARFARDLKHHRSARDEETVSH